MQRILQEMMKKKIILGRSDAWLMSSLSQRPIEPAYYIVDCRIFVENVQRARLLSMKQIQKVINEFLIFDNMISTLIFFIFSEHQPDLNNQKFSPVKFNSGTWRERKKKVPTC